MQLRTMLRPAGLVLAVAAAVAVQGSPAQAAPAVQRPVPQAPVAQTSTRTAPVPSAAPGPDRTVVAELPDTQSAARQAKAQGSRVRVAASGTAASRTYVNPNGTLTTETYADPAFRRAGATWAPLSGAVTGTGTATDPLRVPGLARPVTLGRSAAKLVEIAAPGGTVTLGASGLTLGAPARSGATTTYAGVAKDTDLQLVTSAAGVKTNLVLRSAAAPRSYRFHLADPMGTLGAVAEQKDGSWLFAGSMGDGYRLALAPAASYELNHAGTEPASATQTVVKAGDGFDVTLAVDPAWLAGKSYPIVLDPSPVFVSGPAGYPDCHLVAAPYDDQSFCSSNNREVGRNQEFVRRTIMAFSLSSIPKTAQVSSADLDLNLNLLTGAAPMPVSVHRMTSGWATTATWNYNGGVPWTGGNADLGVELARTDLGSTAGHYHWALTAPTVQGWVSESIPNYGLMLKAPDENVDKLARFDSGLATDSSVRPRLTVNYKDPAALKADRVDSYQPLLSGLVSGTGTYSTTFTVTPPTGLGSAFSSTAASVAAGTRTQYSVPADKVIAGKTYTWTMKTCQGSACTTSATQSFTVDPLIASGDRGFFTYRDWQLSDRLKLRVNAASGNLLAEMTDLSAPGVTGDVALGRTYNSLALAPGSGATAGAAGPGWQASVGSDVRVKQQDDGSATVYTSSGYAALFAVNSTGGFNAPSGMDATLTRPGANWRLKDHKAGATWDFDTAGRLTTVKDRSGNATTIRRDGSGNVSAVDGSRGGPDPTAGTSARRVKVNDGVASTGALRNYRQTPNTGSALADRTVTFGYTGTDLTAVTDAGGKTTTFGYDTSHRLTSVTTPSDANTAAHTTVVTYESGGYRVASIRQETTGSGVGPLTTFVYDDINKQTTVTPPKVNAAGTVQRNVTYTWDNRHRVTRYTNGFGKHLSTRTFNADSQTATSATSANTAAGVSTVNTYDSGNERLTSSVSSASATTNFAGYGGSGSATEFLPGSSTNASGSQSTYRYDGAGNLSANTSGGGNEAIVERNTNGTVKFTTDPENVDDGTSKAAPECRRTGHTDNCTSYSYDAYANLSGTSPPNNAGSLQNRTYQYDGFGRLSTVTNSSGKTVTYSYDAMDRTTKADSSIGTDIDVTYTFDADGNQIQRVDRTGTTTYRYDKLNRLTLKDIGGSATTCPATPSNTKLCYAYDDASNLVSLTDGRGTTTYHYSPISLLDQVVEHTGRTIVMAYDDDQRRVQTWFATDIAANSTVYTASNQLVPPTGWALQAKNTLDGDGRLTRTVSWRGGVADDAHRVADQSYGYKQVALPTACTNTGTTGRGVGTDAGRRTTQTNNISGLAITLCYDTSGRLVYRTSDGSVPYRYTYDKSGNRLTDAANTTVLTYTYNAGNQATTTGFAYDGAGNQTAGTPLAAAAYNGFDQATSLTPTGGSAIALAAAGTTNSELVTQGTTTLTNGVPGVQALGASTYVQRDPKGGLLSLVLGTATTDEYYYVLDGQGSVVGLVDAAGTERARYTYDPYGAHDTATGVNGSLPANPFRYNGGRVVATNSTNQALLYQFGERFYAPTTGRWTQQDNLESLGDPAQGNRYAYAGNDPVNNVDPSGRSWYDPIVDGVESAEYWTDPDTWTSPSENESDCAVYGTAGAAIAVLTAGTGAVIVGAALLSCGAAVADNGYE